MHNVRRFFMMSFLLFLVFLLAGWSEQVQSQEKYPTKPINVIIPFGMGGGCDVVTRLVVPYLTKKWNVAVNVINKPGGNCLPGVMEVYASAPDGYTILHDCDTQSYILLVAVKDLPIKVMDRVFFGTISTSQLFIAVPSSSPCKNLDDVKAEVKKDPENFPWVSLGGVGGTDYTTRQFFKAIGVDVLKTRPIMGRGGGDVGILLAGGHAKLGSASLPSLSPAIQAGHVRLIATSQYRMEEFPEVRTTAEQGYPTVNFSVFYGFSGPPNTPSYIVDIWNRALKELYNNPELNSRIKNIGMLRQYKNSHELREHVRGKIKEVEELYGVKGKE